MTSSAELLGARRLRELLDEFDVHPRKALGQNFVVDPNTIRKVVEVAGVGPGQRVVEIGAGAGSLTLGLAAAGAEVIAVEVDQRLIPILERTVGDLPSVRIVNDDVLSVDLESLGASKLVANLPYNIAATVVVRVLEQAPSIERLTVMTQREVGERLAARPGSKIYGQTSVLISFFATAHVVAPISRRAFYPIPNVDSVLVELVRRDDPLGVDKDRLFRTVKAAFSQRRKTLKNALARIAGSAEVLEEALHAAGVAPDARAEQLPPEAFVELALQLKAREQ